MLILMRCLERSYFPPSSNDILEGLLFFVLHYETCQSAGMSRRYNVSSNLVNFVDRPDSLILDDCHADLSVHDGHGE